ncbi:translation initiation factor IF-2 [Candidatus Dojkabacteria bacterium]|nr:translation initiation factor IF-2 [Candidatus Dojkabacteria bacterium]
MPRKTKKQPKAVKTKSEYEIARPPVVTMLGHVDHGKTSILDAIRGTKVQACEAGGITQSVRAHKIKYKTEKGNEYQMTFIDTPGHKAFTEMRSRGAHVTDIAVLVVAVDDGVKPQTKEAVKFAKEANVPFVVALNKVDIKGTDKNKIKRDLANLGVQAEELGGDVMFIETSAKKRTGLENLLEAVLLTAELANLKTIKPKQGKAEVVVLESTTDKSLGTISFCLVKAGEIKVGDFVASGDECSKIRSILDENLCNQTGAKTSDPVWLTGIDKEIPIGQTLYLYPSISDIKVETKKIKKKEAEKEEDEELDEEILANLLTAREEEGKAELNIILKSESCGTLEVASKELEKLSTDETRINIIDQGTGDINEDDIIKAKTSKGIVIGFRSKLSKKDERIARIEKVLVRNYEIIYELLDEVAEVIESMREPVEKEVEVARAQVKKVFKLSNGEIVAGCKVTKGIVLKGYQCYVERPSLKKDKRIGEGKITSLKYQKEEIREAGKGTECGILLSPQVDIQKDDEVICFKIERE